MMKTDTLIDPLQNRKILQKISQIELAGAAIPTNVMWQEILLPRVW